MRQTFERCVKHETRRDGLNQGCQAPPEVAMSGVLATSMVRVLDHIDYGLLLLDVGLGIRFANRTARLRLQEGGAPARLEHGQLRCTGPRDAASLINAVTGAAVRGKRALLTLGEDRSSMVLAVLPVGDPCRSELALALMGRTDACVPLSCQAFARLHGLTPAEAAVLDGLSKGERPTQMAHRLGVAVSTVRSQLASIRTKVGAPGIADIVRQLSLLPPLLGLLCLSDENARPAR